MSDTLSVEILRQTPLAAELSDEQCRVLLSVMSSRSLSDGDALIEEGGKDDSLHGIYQGMVAVSKNTGGGDWVILHVIRAGELAGEMGFIDSQEHSATLRAVGAAKVFSLRRDKFEALLHTHPDLVYRVMRSLVRSVHGIVRRMNMQYVELNNYISKQHGRY
jgi:CRP-like cAMP-binding protein